jgi:hypothetical protein
MDRSEQDILMEKFCKASGSATPALADLKLRTSPQGLQLTHFHSFLLLM